MNAPVQTAFEFFRDEPMRPPKPERLFFAVLPDGATALRIAHRVDRFVEDNGFKGSRVAADRLHASLQHVGDFKRLRSATLHAATSAGDAVSQRPFETIWHSIGSFGAQRPDGWMLALIGGSEELAHLHRALATAMKENGLAANDQFAPHITLLYGAAPIAVQCIDPIRVTVGDFALVHSARGLMKYSIVKRWPLQGRP